MSINKEIFKKALLAGIFSAFTIGVLTVLTYKSALGLFIAGSFGSSMVLLFGFPESPFAQPKNVFFGHLVTALVGVVFVTLVPLPMYVNIALAVGVGIFLMILFNIVHPPAGGNAATRARVVCRHQLTMRTMRRSPMALVRSAARAPLHWRSPTHRRLTFADQPELLAPRHTNPLGHSAGAACRAAWKRVSLTQTHARLH